MATAAGQKTKLTNLDTKGVAVVTAGANNKKFAIAKASAETIEKAFLAVIEKGGMEMDEASIDDICAKAGCDPQMTETVKAIMKLKHVYRDNESFKGVLKQLMSGGEAEGDKPPPAQDDKKEPPAGEAGDGQKTEDTPAAGDTKEPPMPDNTEEAKKMADLVAKATAEANQKLAEADKKVAALEAVAKAQKEALDVNTEAVKKMQNDLRLSQWVAKAEKELAFIPGKTADELGKMLFDIDTLNPEMAKGQFELLKGQASIVKSSNLFRPSGAQGGAPAGAQNAFAEAEKRAGEIVAKSSLSEPVEVAKARAMTAVFKADPALYKRYCDEQQSINRAAFN